jgi:lipoate-protein ligase A
MQFIDVTLRGPAENLALDEALLFEAEAGHSREVLRLWEWQEAAVVLGSGCRLAEEVDEAACLRDGVPILRRSTGGGTVVLGAGCLCYSLVLAYDSAAALAEIRPSYAYILGRVREALADLLPHIEKAGLSDLAAAGLKFSGNSQQRKRRYLLHHGTLLYDFNLNRVGRYLRMPVRRPGYRHNRDHAAFLTNLPTTADELTRRLCTAWAANRLVSEWPTDLVRQLTAEKYTKPEWIRRR